MLHLDLSKEGAEPTEQAKEQLWKLPLVELDLQSEDNLDYKRHKKTRLPKKTPLLRRQFTLNIVGAGKYAYDAASFDYATLPKFSSMDERSSLLPPEVQASLHQQFGFLVYTYRAKKEDLEIIHYDDSYSAAYEHTMRYLWTHLKNYPDMNGYTAQFLTYNPNQIIREGIEKAIKAKTLPSQKKHLFRNGHGYSGCGLTEYRELSLKSPHGEMREVVELVSLRIDPNNEYGVKNFGDLIDYIRSHPQGKATGTSGTDTSIQHMAMDETVLQELLPSYAKKTEIPGSALYRLAGIPSQKPALCTLPVEEDSSDDDERKNTPKTKSNLPSDESKAALETKKHPPSQEHVGSKELEAFIKTVEDNVLPALQAEKQRLEQNYPIRKTCYSFINNADHRINDVDGMIAGIKAAFWEARQKKESPDFCRTLILGRIDLWSDRLDKYNGWTLTFTRLLLNLVLAIGAPLKKRFTGTWGYSLVGKTKEAAKEACSTVEKIPVQFHTAKSVLTSFIESVRNTVLPALRAEKERLERKYPDEARNTCYASMNRATPRIADIKKMITQIETALTEAENPHNEKSATECRATILSHIELFSEDLDKYKGWKLSFGRFLLNLLLAISAPLKKGLTGTWCYSFVGRTKEAAEEACSSVKKIPHTLPSPGVPGEG